MKRIIFTLALVAIACLSYSEAQAQAFTIDATGIKFNENYDTESTVSVSPIVRVKKKKNSTALYLGKSARSTIPAFEIGWNVLSNVNYAPYAGLNTGDFLDLHNWKSTHVTLNLCSASACNTAIGISTAIGLKFNNYRLDESITLAKGDLIMPIPTEGMHHRSAKKSKFTTAALHIPVELQFGNPRRFAFSVGGYLDMMINNHTKIKYHGGHKDKTWNYPTNFLQAGARARLTFHNFSIFCAYQPTQLFKTGRGPEAQQWTIGIGL